VKLLLDTHILLWSLLEPVRLGPKTAAELEDPGNEIWISPITTWEILILVEKGKVFLEGNPIDWLRDVFSTLPFKGAPVNHEVAFQSRMVNLPHEDPADRLLVATALVYDLTLATADKRLIDSGEFPVLPNK
jgi:PIN domain nuclease of toxin-antitoxin system